MVFARCAEQEWARPYQGNVRIRFVLLFCSAFIVFVFCFKSKTACCSSLHKRGWRWCYYPVPMLYWVNYWPTSFVKHEECRWWSSHEGKYLYGRSVLLFRIVSCLPSNLLFFFFKFIIALKLSGLLEELINFSLAIMKNASLICNFKSWRGSSEL